MQQIVKVKWQRNHSTDDIGRVEAYHNGEWSTVSNEMSLLTDSTVDNSVTAESHLHQESEVCN